MAASLFIEPHANGLAFYINGDLQFDTADEAIYHEHLVIPAIALAAQRFPNTSLRVLIVGGGDGLAARDVLRFAQVGQIDLVDYNPEVLELGRTVFRPYNRDSLVEAETATLGASRVTIYTQDAIEFVAQRPDACYHVVICDFTYPTCPEDCRVYSQEWFQQVNRILLSQGIMSTNGVSPQARTEAFWCLYQTLFAANLQPKPLQLQIPSFHRHGYGDWGFFLASAAAITRSELEQIELPNGLQALHAKDWLNAFVLNTTIADSRHRVAINTMDSPQLFYYLLNPSNASVAETTQPDAETSIDFLSLEETGTGSIQPIASLELAAIVDTWLEQVKQGNTTLPSNLDQLLPVQHRYQTPTMTREWLGYVRQLLAEIDPNQLCKSLLDRAAELPPQLVQELKQWTEKIRTGQPITYLSTHASEFIMLLCVTLLMANLTAPDAVFAKGYSGSRSYGSSSSSSGSYGDDHFPWIGFWMMIIGGFWLSSLYQNRDD